MPLELKPMSYKDFSSTARGMYPMRAETKANLANVQTKKADIERTLISMAPTIAAMSTEPARHSELMSYLLHTYTPAVHTQMVLDTQQRDLQVKLNEMEAIMAEEEFYCALEAEDNEELEKTEEMNNYALAKAEAAKLAGATDESLTPDEKSRMVEQYIRRTINSGIYFRELCPKTPQIIHVGTIVMVPNHFGGRTNAATWQTPAIVLRQAGIVDGRSYDVCYIDDVTDTIEYNTLAETAFRGVSKD